tara:strand:- start:678 stop:788 length:111 start_codon:yes stop_codon:yes gene_type:complete
LVVELVVDKKLVVEVELEDIEPLVTDLLHYKQQHIS